MIGRGWRGDWNGGEKVGMGGKGLKGGGIGLKGKNIVGGGIERC